ncbi:hypothetical protein [Phenylobacterium sp.]|uniref:hypothetical protein n=1 Tax=Phenylobacterium sp. TaxID=1871053 RepID=UPI00374C8BA7
MKTMVSVREGGVIAKKQLALREQLWPGMGPNLWHRLANKGFATIPKTMPLILRIMDEMTKGAPVSSTYLTLWCSTWDNGFVQHIKPDEMAYASGFGGQRGEHTWVGRIKKLQELQFIDLKAGKSGPVTYALIHNPHLIMQWHYAEKTPGLTEASYSALIERALDVGAMDMFPAPPAPPPPAPPLPPLVSPPPPMTAVDVFGFPAVSPAPPTSETEGG